MKRHHKNSSYNTLQNGLEMSREAHHHFCLSVLEKIAAAGNQEIAPEAHQPAIGKFYQRIMQTLLAASPGQSEEEVVAILCVRYRHSKHQLFTLPLLSELEAALLAQGISESRSDLVQFLDHLLHIPPSAQALTFLRQSRSMTQEDLAEELGVSHQLISYWEQGKTPIDSFNFLRLVKALRYRGEKEGLADDEIALFARCMRKELLLKCGDEAWFEERLARKEWDLLVFPAKDKKWLKAQAPYRKAGLWLEHDRESKNERLKQRAAKIHVQPAVLSRWECSTRVIPDKITTRSKNWVERICKAYIKPEEWQLFTDLVKQSNAAIKKRGSITAPHIHLGASMPVFLHPELIQDNEAERIP